MKPAYKKVYIYLTDDKDPIEINAIGYYSIDDHIPEEWYYVIVDHDNQEIARFNKAYVKGIVKQYE